MKILNYFNFLKEGLSFEKVDDGIEICLNDYKVRYENMLKDRYRNMDTGDIIKLKDIFKDKTWGIVINKSSIPDKLNNFYIIDDDVDVEMIKLKSGYHLLFNFPDNSRYWSGSTRINKKSIPSTILELYDIKDYLNDLRNFFYMKSTVSFHEVKKQGYWGNAVSSNYDKTEISSNFYFSLESRTFYIRDSNKYRRYFLDRDRTAQDYSFQFDPWKPIIGTRSRWLDEEDDPFGEEDWDKFNEI